MGAVKRRDLLGLVGLGWLGDACLPDDPPIRGELRGASQRVGHLLRDGAATGRRVATPERAEVVVVGSGASGASAAWRLAALGLEVTMLELESFAGGTSAWGEDGVVPYPWGAHYLPVPEAGARATQRLLRQLGVITGWDASGRPLLQPELLCHAPEERLFYRGQWHMGIVPDAGLSPAERADMKRFGELRAEWREARGSDGRLGFTIPFDQCSRDPRFLALDDLSMADWLQREGLESDFVRWYVEYATRDDFGADLDATSAWAGLHYFCSRRVESEQIGEGSHFLVWPEGNGRLLRGLYQLGRPRRRHGALVLHVGRTRTGVRVDYLDVERREKRSIEARGAVVATPAFVAARLLEPAARERLVHRPSSPWVVANLHVRRPVDPNRAWDNLLYQGPSLGYVDAGHQYTQLFESTVLTYFRAFGARDARGARSLLAGKTWGELAGMAIGDLLPAHPELAVQTERVDVMLWGHAMPRPTPGFISRGAPMSAPIMLDERVAWAHVDQTGFALFEEANQHGVRAAEHLARALGVDAGETWT